MCEVIQNFSEHNCRIISMTGNAAWIELDIEEMVANVGDVVRLKKHGNYVVAGRFGVADLKFRLKLEKVV